MKYKSEVILSKDTLNEPYYGVFIAGDLKKN